MKKILISLAAVVVVAAGIAAMSAGEAHIINVTAHIENALDVHPNKLEFQTVFPEQYKELELTIAMSDSFERAPNADDIEYKIVQKPKCKANDPQDPVQFVPVDRITHECPQGYTAMPLLCPYLSKLDGDAEDGNDNGHPSYFIDPDNDPANPDGDEYCLKPTRIDRTQPGFGDGGWAGWSCPAGTLAVGGGIDSSDNPVGGNGVAAPGAPAVDGFSYPTYPHYTFSAGETGYVVHDLVDGLPNNISFHVDCMPIIPDATGKLAKSAQDFLDLWKIDLKVPPFEGYVAQDWPASCPVLTGDPEGTDYGCDLWIETTGISEFRTP